MKRKVFAILVLSVAAGAAKADTLPEGMSLRATIGASMPQSLHVGDRNFAQDGFVDGDPKGLTAGQLNRAFDAPVVGGGVDYELIKGIRIGAALLYRYKFQLKDHDGHPANPLLDDPGGVTAAKGDISDLSYLATLAWDLPFKLGPLQPFIGGGVGGSTVTSDSMRLTYLGLATSIRGGTKTQLGYQAGAGVSFEIDNSATMELAYQYVGMGDVTYPAQTLTAGGIPQTTSGLKGTLDAHELTASLRFHF